MSISYAVFCLKKKKTHTLHYATSFPTPATTDIYTLSLHDALPIYHRIAQFDPRRARQQLAQIAKIPSRRAGNRRHLQFLRQHLHPALGLIVRCGRLVLRSEEHTSELQSHVNLVCRLLLEKKKNTHASLRYIVSYSRHHRYLHSFPTRRSSDLPSDRAIRSTACATAARADSENPIPASRKSPSPSISATAPSPSARPDCSMWPTRSEIGRAHV